MGKTRLEDINNMRPAEREMAQIKCLKEAFIVNRKFMSVKEMSEYLKNKGFVKGSSEKTIYRRILPQLEKFDIKKQKHNRFYDSKSPGIKYEHKLKNYLTAGIISRKHILWCIKTISELIKTEPLKTQKLVASFLDFQRDFLKKNEDDIFYYKTSGLKK